MLVEKPMIMAVVNTGAVFPKSELAAFSRLETGKENDWILENWNATLPKTSVKFPLVILWVWNVKEKVWE